MSTRWQQLAGYRPGMRPPEGWRWRYLSGGTVIHALAHSDDAGARCGVYTLPASNWRGTGSQAEYERAATLALCGRCMRIIEGRPS